MQSNTDAEIIGEDREIMQAHVNEADWKLFRSRLPGGQEACMDLNIMSLIADGVIGLDDLEGFSDDLREKMSFIMRE